MLTIDLHVVPTLGMSVATYVYVSPLCLHVVDRDQFNCIFSACEENRGILSYNIPWRDSP
jgi:hypothetical protein